MHLEVKFFLAFGTAMLFVLYIGQGGLSFDEAKFKAEEDESSLSSRQKVELEKTQEKFSTKVFPRCVKVTETEPGNFTVVIEIGPEGNVTRSWRQGDSKFVVCIQKNLTDNFFFRSVGRSFLTSFEYKK